MVKRLIIDSYAEFEPAVAPDEWATLNANLAAVVDHAPLACLVVAEVAGRLAGTVTYYPPGPKDYRRVPPEWAVIRALGVAPGHRRHGVARLLTDECLRRARADSAPAVGLHTAELFTAARRLYEGLGFTAQREFRHLGLRFLVYARHL